MTLFIHIIYYNEIDDTGDGHDMTMDSSTNLSRLEEDLIVVDESDNFIIARLEAELEKKNEIIV